MTLTLTFLLLLLAAICFIWDALALRKPQSIALTPLGLFFYVLTHLLGAVR